MTQHTSPRTMARQNLLVAAVNEALTRQLITLECEPVTPATFEFTLDGRPVISYVDDAGFDEVTVHVTCRPTALGQRDIHCAILHEWRKFGEAVTFGWLERRSGKYLQSGIDYHGTKQITKALGALMVEPRGFDTKPVKDSYDFHLEFESVFGPVRRGRHYPGRQ